MNRKPKNFCTPGPYTKLCKRFFYHSVNIVFIIKSDLRTVTIVLNILKYIFLILRSNWF